MTMQTFKKPSSVYLILLLLACFPAKALENHGTGETTVGELTLKSTNDSTINAPLLSTDIDVEVNGLISTIIIEQRFQNTTTDWVNGRYVFPLPENGAVDGMTMQIGDRVIKGEIKEKTAAKKIFIEAKKAGKKASLLQQHRPNLFSMAVANIPPNGEVITKIRLIDLVRYDQQQFSLRIPTTITPRYIPGNPIELNIEETQDVEINTHTGWGVNTNIVPDATAITPPQKHTQSIETTSRFSLQLNLNAGVDLERIFSQSHEIAIDQDNDNSKAIIQLKNNTEAMNSDFVIHWSPVKSYAPTAALFQQIVGGDQYLMAMLLPPTANVDISLAKEITFIIDSSGSMAGQSMISAKESLLAALQQLSSTDKFNIIDFDSNYQLLFNQPQIVNNSNISKAMHMIQRISADGGTEMYRPLEYALNTSTDEQYLKQIVFITDGSVGNEQELFKLISDKLGSARLFTVGIGSAPNSHFMNRAAKFGKGTFTYIANLNDSTEKMNALFKRINRPVARDIQIAFQSNDLRNKKKELKKIDAKKASSVQVEQFPQNIPDLYANEPIIILTKSNDSIQSIEISGNLLGNAWKRAININRKELHNVDNIDALWARKKVSHLMDELYAGKLNEENVKPTIIELGIKHHLMTKFTSFVAVEKKPSKPKGTISKNKNIANLMPKGSVMPAPQTATAASLYGLIGIMLLLLAGLLRKQQQRHA